MLKIKGLKIYWVVFRKHYLKHYGKIIKKRKIRVKVELENSIQGGCHFVQSAFEVCFAGDRDCGQKPGTSGGDPEEIS